MIPTSGWLTMQWKFTVICQPEGRPASLPTFMPAGCQTFPGERALRDGIQHSEVASASATILLDQSSSPSWGYWARRPTRTSPTPALTPLPGLTPGLVTTTMPSNCRETTRKSFPLWTTSPISYWTDAETKSGNPRQYLKFGPRNSGNSHWLTFTQSIMANLIKLLVLRLGRFASDRRAQIKKVQTIILIIRTKQ